MTIKEAADIWRELESETGVNSGFVVVNDLTPEGFFDDPNMAVNWVDKTIEVNRRALLELSRSDLKGIMAHEMGHIALAKSINSPTREFDADKWAAEHGYAKENIQALLKGRNYPAGFGYPSRNQRVKFFQSYIS